MFRRDPLAILCVPALAALLLLAGAGTGSAAAAPPNDDFANAQVVSPTLPVSIPATNVGSTAEAGEPDHYSVNEPQHSVWFRWTAPASTRVTVSSCQPDLNFGQVAVYTGSAVGALTEVLKAGSCIGRFDAVAGTEYSIVVEGGFEERQFQFDLRQFTPPANDNFASPMAVGPALPVNQPASNVDSTVEPGEPIAHGGEGRSIWFSWTAPEAGATRLDTCDFDLASGSGNSGIFVYTGSTLGTLVTVAEESNGCKLSFNASKGTAYRIAFSGTIRGEGNLTLRILDETPPANDDFANAQPIGPGLPVGLSGTNVFATVEAGEPHHGSDDESNFEPHDTVWYSWTPNVTAEVRIRVCDADFGAHLGVYTGNAVNTLTRVTPSEPILSFPFCAIRFQAQQGIAYRIAVGGFGAEEEGAFRIDIHRFAPPANDDLISAQPIGPGLPIAVHGSNLDASAEHGEPGHEVFDDDQPNASVWYSWTPTASTDVRVSTCGSQLNGPIAVYTGQAVENLTEIATAKDICGVAAGVRLDFHAIAGTRYQIAVDGFFQQEGSFDLSLIDLNAKPPPAPTAVVPKAKPRFSLRRALKRCRKIKHRKPRRRCVAKARHRARQIRLGA